MEAAEYFRRNPVAGRLGKLAAAHRTGALHVPGDLGGAIYFQDGQVVYAKSRRTPGPGGLPAQSAGRGGASMTIPDLEAYGSPRWRLTVREATIDASLELVSARARYSSPLRFRPTQAPRLGDTTAVPVDELLAELARRMAVLRQLSAVVTADSPLIRTGGPGAAGVRVSALQWALLIRVDGRCTPRGLALELGRGVFATTVEVSRLLRLRLLAVAGAPGTAPNRGPAGPPGLRLAAVSYIQAVTG